MLRFLLLRPVAVGMSFLVCIALGMVAFFGLPVSLLPNIDVPCIIIKVNYPNASPLQLEQNVLRPIREQLLTLAHLKDIQSTAYGEAGTLTLRFEYNSPMELLYVETNEKIDRLIPALPRDLVRPQVVRLNTSDIPIIRLQLTPRPGSNMEVYEVSQLAQKVLRKRLEALAGISLIDLNGLQYPTVVISPRSERLRAFGITVEAIQNAIRQSNQGLGSVSVRDGQYRYYLKLGERLPDARAIAALVVRNPEGQIIPLSELAHLRDTLAQAQGFHLFVPAASAAHQPREAIVMNIHLQAQARTTDVMPHLEASIAQFKEDYPEVDFHITQDQSYLLRVAIDNLLLDLVLGGGLAFLIVWVFLGSWQIPTLIGVILPSSLVLSFVVFYVFGISLNIISLSGLTLGLGMTIDNAIILFDHISHKRREGLSVFEACVRATMEIMPPLVSSALTTLAVFLPLTFLGGMAGVLSYEQAVAVGAILGASVLVSFLLLPLLYLLLFRNRSQVLREDSRVYAPILRAYKRLYAFFFRHQQIAFWGLLAIGVLGIGLAVQLPKAILPTIAQDDFVVEIDWRAPLDVNDNKQRIGQLLATFAQAYTTAEADIGLTQFWLQQEESTIQKAKLYVRCAQPAAKNRLTHLMQAHIQQQYPQATVLVYNAPNAFELLFQQNTPYWEARFKHSSANMPLGDTTLQAIYTTLQAQFPKANLAAAKGTHPYTSARLRIARERLAHYGIKESHFIQHLQQTLGSEKIDDLKQFGETIPIRLQASEQSLDTRLGQALLVIDSTRSYPTTDFVEIQYYSHYQALTADKGGIYHGIQTFAPSDASALNVAAKRLAQDNNVGVSFVGEFQEQALQQYTLLLVLGLALGLLYFILAIEFESLVLPVVVMLTLPLGFAGSFVCLWLAGASLNVMAGLGLVVMLGIIDNETILKIDTYQRLRAEGYSLEAAVARGGEICFKPVLMTSLTNILALLPIVFSEGIGADLQRPFVLAIIGGLSIGTFTALFFVPLAYLQIARWLMHPKTP